MEEIGQQTIEGIQKYCNLLEEVKLRIKSVQTANLNRESSGVIQPFFREEYIFIQIRKILELIAFGSMASNVELYKDAYKTHSRHWKAKDILEKLEKINKDFYPLPLMLPNSDSPCELENVREGFLSRDDFIELYDISSGVIHSSNPFSQDKREAPSAISIDEWMHRITSLLWFHQIKLAKDDRAWLVYLIHPGTQKVKALAADLI